MLTLPPLSLYVHIPWCVRKCPYCDFNSHEAPQALPEADYVDALLRDLDLELDHVQGRPLGSIFFGGGTPSLFSPQAIGRILERTERRTGFAPDIEITLEANPGTLEQDRFRGYRAAGVNRLSIGIQSFDNRHLQRLGRIHDRASAVVAAERARAAGFDSFNLDLMHGLPEQTPDEAIADLELARTMAPSHLSWYQLTIEPNTAFWKSPPPLPPEDTLETIQQAGFDLLGEAGYRQYEVSAFAREGRASRHNLNYWQFGDYLGIGAGAHGKITRPASGEILRYAKTRLPTDYLARRGDFLATSQPVPQDEKPLEFLMNALRLLDGVPAAWYGERTGLALEDLAPQLEALRQQGLLVPDPNRLQCTAHGYRFLDSLLQRLAT